VLLAANGFFVAAEFALVKARGFRIQALADQGNASAALTVRIQHNLEAYLAACQLGITMASLGLGWVGEPTVEAMLKPLLHSFALSDQLIHTISFITGFLIFSSLHIIVGEQVPKTFAIRKPEPISMLIAYPLHWTYLSVYPLNWLLNKATSSILSLFGVQEAGHGDIFTGDEIKGMVETSREHGEIEHNQANMLNNLFEFDQRQVARVMIPLSSVNVLDIAADANDNLKIIRESGHSRFPVIDSDNDDAIKGLLLTRDIYSALIDGAKEPWKDLTPFCREPLVIPETQRVAELFDLMRSSRAHMAFLVNEYGNFIGIITLEDLLEEIVGEIHDETDTEKSSIDIQSVGEDLWEADGLVSISDLERATGYKADTTLGANTLSGLFLQKLQRMPEAEDDFEDKDYSFRALNISNRRVGRVRIEKLPVDLQPLVESDQAADEKSN
jgi:CBS domain containing-hemolysin-like protein